MGPIIDSEHVLTVHVGLVAAILNQAVAVSLWITFLEPEVRQGMKVIVEDMLMLFDASVEPS